MSSGNNPVDSLSLLSENISSLIFINERESQECIFEISDFTSATPWETFISTLANVLSEWKKIKLINFSCPGTHLSRSLSYNDIKFVISFYTHGSSTILYDNSFNENTNFSFTEEMMSEEHACMFEDFPYQIHPVTKFYGVKNFALIYPQEPKFQQLWTLSQSRFLLSSILAALATSDYQIPIFFRTQEANRQMFIGVGHYEYKRTWFEMVQLRSISPHLQNLDSLVELFKSKLPFDNEFNILASIKYTYQIDLFTFVTNFPLSSHSSFAWDKLPFGSKYLPIRYLYLSALWPSQNYRIITETQSYSDLDPTCASKWFLGSLYTNNNEYYLSQCLETFSSLFNINESMANLVDKLVIGVYFDKQQQNTRKFISYVTRSQQLESSNNNTIKDIPLKISLLQSMMSFIFDAKSLPKSSIKDSIKSAPSGSLTFKFSLCACIAMYYYGGIQALLQLWHEFTSELRRHFELGIQLPDILNSTPDFNYGLFHQKLQMLQYCIQFKNDSSTNNLVLQSSKSLSAASQGNGNSLVLNKKHSPSDSECDFYEALEEASINDFSENLLLIDRKQLSEDDSIYQSFPHIPSIGLGIDKETGMNLIMTGETLYAPIVQNHPPVTEDVLRDQSVNINRENASSYIEDNNTFHFITLKSDMSAFKAANPASIFEDFVRWYSPKDYISEDDDYSSMCSSCGIIDDLLRREDSKDYSDIDNVINQLQSPSNITYSDYDPKCPYISKHDNLIRNVRYVKGYLSERIRGENSIWLTAWRFSESIPACKQKQLFNLYSVSEEIFTFLNKMTPKDLACLIFPCILHICYLQLAELPVAMESNCEKYLIQFYAKLQEFSHLNCNDTVSEIPIIKDCLKLLSQIDHYFSSTHALYHCLMYGYNAFNEIEMNNSFIQVNDCFQKFVSKILTNPYEIEIPECSSGITGQALRGILKSLQTSNNSIKLKSVNDNPIGSTAQGLFGRTISKEYIFHCFSPNPCTYSSKCNHRMFASISQNESRIASAITEDLIIT